jgi:hypothetical protein
MPCVCPICKSRALELVRTGDATGFYCKIHGHFKIANTVALDDYYARAEWEVALRAALGALPEGRSGRAALHHLRLDRRRVGSPGTAHCGEHRQAAGAFAQSVKAAGDGSVSVSARKGPRRLARRGLSLCMNCAAPFQSVFFLRSQSRPKSDCFDPKISNRAEGG